jgi:hypothetical protein
VNIFVDIGASDERFEDMVIVALRDGDCCDVDHCTCRRGFLDWEIKIKILTQRTRGTRGRSKSNL